MPPGAQRTVCLFLNSAAHVIRLVLIQRCSGTACFAQVLQPASLTEQRETRRVCGAIGREERLRRRQRTTRSCSSLVSCCTDVLWSAV